MSFGEPSLHSACYDAFVYRNTVLRDTSGLQALLPSADTKPIRILLMRQVCPVGIRHALVDKAGPCASQDSAGDRSPDLPRHHLLGTSLSPTLVRISPEPGFRNNPVLGDGLRRKSIIRRSQLSPTPGVHHSGYSDPSYAASLTRNGNWTFNYDDRSPKQPCFSWTQLMLERDLAREAFLAFGMALGRKTRSFTSMMLCQCGAISRTHILPCCIAASPWPSDARCKS